MKYLTSLLVLVGCLLCSLCNLSVDAATASKSGKKVLKSIKKKNSKKPGFTFMVSSFFKSMVDPGFLEDHGITPTGKKIEGLGGANMASLGSSSGSSTGASPFAPS
jgi:hypothetical protein